MKITLTGLSLFVLYGLTTGYRVHIYVSTPMTANDAYTYCTTNYKDLSSITSKEEYQGLVEAAGGQLSEAWIGLHRGTRNPNIWTWTDGQPHDFTKLYIYNSNDSNCVYATKLEWFNGFCPDKRPFFCYYNYNLSLVTTNMTWQDALMYCRNQFIDLVSATEQYQLKLMQDTIKDSTTDSVWTGLRFLEGEWHWVSKTFIHIPYQGSLPSCPEEPYRCGAYTKTTAQWEMRDCDEMLNFICY
ncbi:hypothetical protein ABG768_000698 [Culter alburnus]|uniref:C-type lectin domain-containing protein n=1 Tax=Culter alburnus TaxID=194366 RepID=A0AAW2B6Q6_CULAL